MYVANGTGADQETDLRFPPANRQAQQKKAIDAMIYFWLAVGYAIVFGIVCYIGWQIANHR